MTVSRRSVLLQGGVFGAGVIAAGIPGLDALAQGQPPERRSLEGLAWNDPIVSTYRDGVGILKQKAANDKLGWAGLATIHGSDPGTYHFCPHGNWYFLPWHRAFVVMYERIIRDVTKNKDFAIPYWDWTANPVMPPVFLTPKTPDGKTNWLFVDDRDFGQRWRRTWPNNKPMPADQVGPTVLQQILASTDYEEFGTSRPAGQNNLDQSWIVDQNSGDQGILEGLAHNMVHNNIGGWMPSASSPRDPIFFMHHGNIDRIWALWNSLGNQNSGESLWNDMQIQNNFLNPDGSFYSPKVSELYVPEDLGYTYNLGTQMSFNQSPSVMALHTNLRALRGPAPAPDAKVQKFSAPAQGAATPGKPLSISIPVDAALVTQVARRRPVSSGRALLGFAAARDQRASGTRALAFVRDVAVTGPRQTEFRIFLDAPEITTPITAQTPTTDPRYVGSFGVINHGTEGHGKHANPSFAVDLTAAIQRVYGSVPQAGGRIGLQILPVSSGDGKQAGTARPSRVEVAFVTS
jgi:tyrosinase